jgi:hypothetical protein
MALLHLLSGASPATVKRFELIILACHLAA